MIEVIHYERANKGKVIGYVDILLPAWKMIIRKIAHIEGENGSRWFKLPSFQRQRTHGSHEYLNFWQFETEVHNSQLLNHLADRVKEYCYIHQIADIPALKLDVPPISFEQDLPF